MLWSARYPEEIHLERSDFRGRHFNTVLAARPCLCDIVPSKSKLVGRSKPCNWLGFLHKVSRICFFPNDYPLHYLHHFGVCSIFGSKQYDSRAAITQSGGDKPCCDLSGKISQSEWCHENVPGCWVLFKMAATMYEFRTSLETTFLSKNCTLQAGEWLNLVQGFYWH